MDGVICAIFLLLIAVVTEILIEKIIMHMSEKGSSSEKGLLILGGEIL